MSNHEDDAIGRLTDLARARARAESRETEAMLRYRDAEIARTEDVRPVLRRQIERAAIALEIGQAMGLSEGQVHHRLASAERVREHAPQTWLAFRDGRINEPRVREISQAINTLQRPESLVRLDQRVVAYAETHTVPELRRFVQRVEADLALERAERARADRRVEVQQGEDGMAVLWALLPAPQAAAIERRLAHEAKALGSTGLGADDPRTTAQRRADLLAAWLTTNEASESADGSWSAPASWVLDPELVSNVVWHRLIVDPVTDDVLAHQYVGRLAPDSLKIAAAFRDGVCQAPGCLVPADQCDLDHREPWPEGLTSGENMWPPCRRRAIGTVPQAPHPQGTPGPAVDPAVRPHRSRRANPPRGTRTTTIAARTPTRSTNRSSLNADGPAPHWGRGHLNGTSVRRTSRRSWPSPAARPGE